MRFTGACDLITSVDVADLVSWIGAIDFTDWPQQGRLADGLIRPSMVTDPEWFGFGKKAEPVVAQVMTHFPDGSAYLRMLSVVMPGHSIEPHRDSQAPYWQCRVHVPLATNEHSAFIVAGERFALEVGKAYRVNTEAEHSVENDGDTPRIHFMFDVRSSE